MNHKYKRFIINGLPMKERIEQKIIIIVVRIILFLSKHSVIKIRVESTLLIIHSKKKKLFLIICGLFC